MTFTTALALAIIGSALSAPLLYAVRTLLGMQHKMMYPLLRTRNSEARVRPLIRTQFNPNKGGQDGHREPRDDSQHRTA
jgi:hypothetical protein